MAYRKLTFLEVLYLKKHGCSSSDWSQIVVGPEFDISKISNVRFGVTSHPGYPFAQGVPVEVLDETGSLSVAIHDKLSYQEALGRIHGEQPSNPLEMVSLASSFPQRGGIIIERNVTLQNVGLLSDVWLHAGASVIGASRVNNCSIYGCVGANTILDDVIVLDHSHVTDGACLDHCFVGQGTHIGRMYSATQSLFFCNCHFENGEACAYLAGPYSVSHHKSTLMIACMTSFFNAGSGSNQSNHSYKLGPNKWGVLSRGTKLGSSSYLYWPARVGEFSTVIGHHLTHFDLIDLPFTLIVEGEGGQTHLIPGQIFASCGLRRDLAKWPERDVRGEYKLDEVEFELFTDEMVKRLTNGLQLLRELHKKTKTGESATYEGCVISHHNITRGIKMYELALRVAAADEQAMAEWTEMLDQDAERDKIAYQNQYL